MVIAVTVTFHRLVILALDLFMFSYLVIGGSIEAFIAYRIPMTAMPELVAGFHSLVGLGVVFVAISIYKSCSLLSRYPGNIKLGA